MYRQLLGHFEFMLKELFNDSYREADSSVDQGNTEGFKP